MHDLSQNKEKRSHSVQKRISPEKKDGFVTSKQLNQAEINQLTSCVGKLFALVNYLFCFFPLTQKKIRKKKKTKKKKKEQKLSGWAKKLPQ